eukprot:gene10685-11857_t
MSGWSSNSKYAFLGALRSTAQMVSYEVSIAETNRHPFDLPEAEAELVSGYNVEYSAMGFALFSLGDCLNLEGFWGMADFIVELLAGYYYALEVGALDWE